MTAPLLLPIRDALAHSQPIREGAGWMLAQAARFGSPEQRRRRLVRAFTLREHPRALDRIASVLCRGAEIPESPSPVPPVCRTLLLKAPGPDGEKGVLLTYFEYNWASLADGIPDYPDFSRRYTVVHLPSWSPTNYAILGRVVRRTAPGVPVYVQPANPRDRDKLSRFHPALRVVEGLACDWVHPRYFQPRPWAERDIDLLVVSNWAPFKRHWELFLTLARLPKDLRVVCVGQPDSGKTLADIRRLQRQFRAPQEIEYLDRIPIDRVTDLQGRAKISALFSRWEGGCVAAVESLMAGAVLAMRDDARVGARAHVNADTGVTFLRSDAPARLLWALEHGASLRPREWAMENIASDLTLARLNARLRADSLAAGLPWTADLAPMCYRPYLTLVNESDRSRLAPAAAELHRRYPAVFTADWMDIASR